MGLKFRNFGAHDFATVRSALRFIKIARLGWLLRNRESLATVVVHRRPASLTAAFGRAFRANASAAKPRPLVLSPCREARERLKRLFDAVRERNEGSRGSRRAVCEVSGCCEISRSKKKRARDIGQRRNPVRSRSPASTSFPLTGSRVLSSYINMLSRSAAVSSL